MHLQAARDNLFLICIAFVIQWFEFAEAFSRLIFQPFEHSATRNREIKTNNDEHCHRSVVAEMRVEGDGWARRIPNRFSLKRSLDLLAGRNWSPDGMAVYYWWFIKDRFAGCKLITVYGMTVRATAVTVNRRPRSVSLAQRFVGGIVKQVRRPVHTRFFISITRGQWTPGRRRGGGVGVGCSAGASSSSAAAAAFRKSRSRWRRWVPVTFCLVAFDIDDKNAVWKLIGFPILYATSFITEPLLGNI